MALQPRPCADPTRFPLFGEKRPRRRPELWRAVPTGTRAVPVEHALISASPGDEVVTPMLESRNILASAALPQLKPRLSSHFDACRQDEYPALRDDSRGNVNILGIHKLRIIFWKGFQGTSRAPAPGSRCVLVRYH